MATTDDAVEELPKKLKHERQMKADLIELFDEMSEELFVMLLATGIIPDFTSFTNEMRDLLRRNYRRTSKDFKFNIRSLDSLNLTRNTSASQIDQALNNYFDMHSRQQSQFIITGTNNQARKAFDKVNTELFNSSETVSGEEIATRTNKIFNDANVTRSDRIAQTEVQNAAETSKQIEAEQLLATNAIKSARKEWDAILDSRTRFAHAAADGQKVNVGDPFFVGSQSLKYPGDMSLGASLDNVINCLHPSSVVSFADIIHLTRRFYEGQFICIKTCFGHKISVTPNHPILTISGWKAANLIDKSDKIISTFGKIYSPVSGKCFNIQNVNAPIEQVFNSCRIAPITVGTTSSIVNFHGDIGDIASHDVDIVPADGFLESTFNSSFSKLLHKFDLPQADFLEGLLLASRLLEIPGLWGFHRSSSFIGFFSSILSLFKRATFSINSVLFTSGPNRTTSNLEPSSDNPSRCSKFYRNLKNRFTSRIKVFNNRNLFFASKVLEINHFKDSCYVYNLETSDSMYVCNGIVNHNCRCSSTMSVS